VLLLRKVAGLRKLTGSRCVAWAAWMNYSSTAQLHWNFTVPASGRSSRCVAAFRAWHKAVAIGAEVESLRWGALEPDAETLRILNGWIRAGGAWRSSALDAAQAETVLCNVLHGISPVLPVGTAGGGRSARAPVLPLCWYQPQSFQGKFRL